MKNTIAIILVNFNSLNDTKDCLESIFKSADVDPFVVLVDNNSKNQEEILELNHHFKNLKIILNKENVGFGKANNIGINWAIDNISCDYVFILNNDTTIETDCLIELLKSKKKIDNEKTILAPLILNIDTPPTVWYAGGNIDWKKCSAKVDFIRFPSNHKEVNLQREVTFASGCAMFFSIAFLKELKGFDPYFFMYEEDVELSLRVVKECGCIVYEPKAIVNHKCQGSATTKTTNRNQLDASNPNLNFYLKHIILGRIYNIKKYGNIKQRLNFLLYNIAYWGAKSIQYLSKGKFRSFLLVYKYIFKGYLKQKSTSHESGK